MSEVITIDDLNSYSVGKTLDQGLAQLIVDAANAMVDTRTGRVFGSTAQVTERCRWKGSVWLRHMDVQSIDQVEIGLPGQTPSVVSTSAYYLDPLGCLTFYSAPIDTGSRFARGQLSVTYTYGTDEVPDDLKLALLGLASSAYEHAQNGERDIAGTQVGSYSVQYISRGGPGLVTASASNLAVIDSYRLRRQ